jgi:hypothetical protein
MYYENESTKKGFIVWNSRDGVTPFIVFADGQEYMHKHWGMDAVVTNPHYINREILKPGQRIFRDTSEQEAKVCAIRRLQSARGTEYEVEENSSRWNELISDLTKNFIGEPNMLKVTVPGMLP